MAENNKKIDISKFTFVSGAELPNKELIMIAHPFGMDPGKNPKTTFLTYNSNDGWSSLGSVKWLPEGVCSNAKQDSIFIAHLGGTCLELNKNKNTFSNIYATEEDKDDPPSELRFSKVIGGELYVGGTNRYLFKQVGAHWEEISIEAMKGEPIPSSFENITGFNAKELYAFGWEGVIWTNKGGTWKEVDSTTEDILLDGAVLDDKVYIGSEMGTILIGRDDKWEELENELSDYGIDSVCSFGDSVYFSNTENILRLKDRKLEVFIESTNELNTFKLFTGPSGLWSVSDKNLAVYNGKEWNIIK
ncbi:MAG: hypothetical protein ACRBFS_25370 [Aureispira sp.]